MLILSQFSFQFWHDVNIFPIDPIENVILWKLVINQVTNVVHV